MKTERIGIWADIAFKLLLIALALLWTWVRPADADIAQAPQLWLEARK